MEGSSAVPAPAEESRSFEAECAALYAEHAGRVYGFLVRMLGSRDEAEDVLQDTYVQACRSLRGGFRPEAPLAWLLTIARNLCISRFRAARPAVALDLVDAIPALPDFPRAELFGLSEALARLPETQRRVLVLREWCGLSYDEIADELSLSRAAVTSHVHRGRSAVAARLRTGRRRSRAAAIR